MTNPASEVTGLLEAWAGGDVDALDELWVVLYRDLRGLAGGYLRNERRDHTLQATDLVHDAYLRLVDQERVNARHRGQFFALAAQTMRHILVDHARKRLADKRGGGRRKISLEDLPHLKIDDAPELVALDDALVGLADVDPDLAKLVELRFFGGFKNEDLARHFELSIPTIVRRWRVARAWLYRELAVEAG